VSLLNFPVLPLAVSDSLTHVSLFQSEKEELKQAEALLDILVMFQRQALSTCCICAQF